MVDTADLLFELGTEELPPVALLKLSKALTEEFKAGLDNAELAYGAVHSYATPRRLAVRIDDLQITQPDKEITRRGPAVQAAFDADGNPTKAAEGFARSCGVTVADLDRMETDKGTWLMYELNQAGKSAKELLPGIAEKALGRLPIPKRMRWGSSEAAFVRPVHWLVFLLGDEVVPCELLEAKAGRETRGHRFHSEGTINIDSARSYADQLLNEGHVIAGFEERLEKVREQVRATAESLGGDPQWDDELLEEVTALVEWPVPVAGGFDADFLSVPHEALILTMKKNQKYFPVLAKDGSLMPNFITLSNVDSKQPEVIQRGNERVVLPRLADARFFWEQDGKRRLEDHVEGLAKVVFQKDLGSLQEKSNRVAQLAASIALGIGGDEGKALRAAHLSRCDLLTEMVYEFPEMQGIMGRYQAKRDGEDPEVAQALDEFYMPRFSGDDLPSSKTGAAIALAERLDTLVGIFGIGQKPTGDKDPFALRRASLGALRILQAHGPELDLLALLEEAELGLRGLLKESDVAGQVFDYMLERLRAVYMDEGVDAKVFESVAELKPSCPGDFDRRIKAVVDFTSMAEAEALSAANKRVRNILKKVEGEPPQAADPKLLSEPAEERLHQALESTAKAVAPYLEQGQYTEALRGMAGLRDAIDEFFDAVMVMADDHAVRNNRIALLNGMDSLFSRVADISKLQG